MAVYEGRGKTAPKPIQHRFSQEEMACILCEARRRSEHRSYNRRKDKWGRGLISNPILVGMAGETAMARYLGTKADFRLNSGDNGIDLEVGGITIQVKTRQPNSGVNYIRRVDHNKRLRPLVADAFAFVQWRPEQPAAHLLGWIWRRDLPKTNFGKSHVANHYNIFVKDEMLEPISRLRMEAKGCR